MDDKSMDRNYPVKPAEKHEAGITLPSQERLEGLMVGPRKHAKYFDDTIIEQYPASPNDEVIDNSSKQTPKTISSEFDDYEKGWLTPHLADTEKLLQPFVSGAHELSPEGLELLFHKLNQDDMSQWHEVFGIPKPKKNREIALNTAQIRLAIDSVLMLSNVDNFENIEHLDKALNIIDAMIILTQRSIDGGPMNEPQVYVAHPRMGLPGQEALFIKFEPTDHNSYLKTELTMPDVIDAGHIPGSVAIEVLNGVRINEVSYRPEFKDKAQFHKLVLAHQKARQLSAKPTELS